MLDSSSIKLRFEYWLHTQFEWAVTHCEYLYTQVEYAITTQIAPNNTLNEYWKLLNLYSIRRKLKYWLHTQLSEKLLSASILLYSFE